MLNESVLLEQDKVKKLQAFLLERKWKLLEMEKRATRSAKAAILGQIQAFESILIFLTTLQEASDMDALKLSLDKQAKPLADLAPRQHSSELTQALLDLADTLKPGTYKQINTQEVKPKSIVSKVYALRKTGRLPEAVVPVTRGKDVFIARRKN